MVLEKPEQVYLISRMLIFIWDTYYRIPKYQLLSMSAGGVAFVVFCSELI